MASLTAPDKSTTLNCRAVARDRLRGMADKRGMKMFWFIEALLSGWQLLTPAQRDAAASAATSGINPQESVPLSDKASDASPVDASPVQVGGELIHDTSDSQLPPDDEEQQTRGTDKPGYKKPLTVERHRRRTA